MSLRASFACNDPDNGNDTGYADAVDVASMQLRGGRPIRFYRNHDRLRFGRLRIPFAGYINWYGNWCWDSVRVCDDDAAKIINYCKRAGWDCEEAEQGLFEAWDNGVEFTKEMIRKSLEAREDVV